jgi:hypothetical protein
MNFSIESAYGRYRVWTDSGESVLILPSKAGGFLLSYPGNKTDRKIIGVESSVESAIHAAQLFLSTARQLDIFNDAFCVSERRLPDGDLHPARNAELISAR